MAIYIGVQKCFVIYLFKKLAFVTSEIQYEFVVIPTEFTAQQKRLPLTTTKLCKLFI